MKKIILVLSIALLIISCAKKEKVPGVVGQKIHLAAKPVVSESDTAGKHFQWQFAEKPIGSQVGALDIQPNNEEFNIYYIPDVPGKYVLTCSIINQDGTVAEKRKIVCPVKPDTGTTKQPTQTKTRESEKTKKGSAKTDSEEVSPEYGFVKEDTGKEKSQQQKEVNIQKTEETPSIGTAGEPQYTIQITSRKKRKLAEKDVQNLTNIDYKAYIQEKNFAETNETWYRVRLGSFTSYKEAKKVAQRINNKLSNKGYSNCWIDQKRK